LLQVSLVFRIVENLANTLRQRYFLNNARRTQFRNNNRINLRIFLFEKRAIKRDIFLLITIVIRANFVCTNIIIRIISQKEYSNIFASILLREIARIWFKNNFVRLLSKTIISRDRARFIIWFLKSILIIIL